MIPESPAGLATGLPLRFGPVRRTRCLGTDSISSTWEGWEGWRGVRVRLRILAASMCGSEAARLTLRAASAGRAVLGVNFVEEPWPHLVSAPIRRTLADLLPWDDYSDPMAAVRVLGGATGSLAAHHAAGFIHGAVVPENVVLDEVGWKLLWLGPNPDAAPMDPSEDLRELGHVATLLTLPEDPVGGLLAGFIDYPPPSAGDASRLLAAALGASLAAERHDLVHRHRSFDRRSRISRLRLLATRLADFPPPAARGCLQADADAAPCLIASDGASVYGGYTPELGLTGLPSIANRHDMDVAAVRAHLRAARSPGDSALRDALTEMLGGDRGEVERLLRWLAATMALRSERRLLAARGG